jgi:RNA-splicing ligase RtcB
MFRGKFILVEDMWITRKGAVRARAGELVIIPVSMGTRSYIARGLGNPDSFESCSHGAGRRMSRGEAKRRFTVKDLESQTSGVECRKDSGVIDEIPGAYKDIDAVMLAQESLVEPLFRREAAHVRSRVDEQNQATGVTTTAVPYARTSVTPLKISVAS